MTLVGDRGQEFDYVNTATALQRAAKLQGNPSQLRPILEMVQQQLPFFKPLNLATASWSFARLQVRDRHMLHILGQSVLSQLD